METSAANSPNDKVIVGDQAQQNLKLTAKPLKAEAYWKTISVPGSVTERPGISDREVAAPAIGVISEVRRVPGDAVNAGDVLFVLKLTSDSLHETQAHLFKTVADITLAQARLDRLKDAADAIARARLVEVESEIRRLEVAAKADQEQLRNRGLSPADVDSVASGKLVSEVQVIAPTVTTGRDSRFGGSTQDDESTADQRPLTYELQQLKVETGQQVQAGETLCLLSNHKQLAIEGRAFRDETPLLERSVQNSWTVDVDFQESGAADWPPMHDSFLIHYLSNTVDPVTRTFGFLLPLENQSKLVPTAHGQQRLWRFRPGQKVWLQVRVEQLDNVFVVPKDAAVWEGPEAYVFTQNVNTFERKGVRVLHQDREHIVIANDGSLPTYKRNEQVFTIPAIVQTAAAQLNRMIKSGRGSVPKGYHIHADGSLHKSEDEGK